MTIHKTEWDKPVFKSKTGLHVRKVRPTVGVLRSKAGFSLLELMAVMLLMFIMMGIATTAFRGIMRGAGLRGATSTVRGALTQARQQAMTQGQPVAVIIEPSEEYGNLRTIMSFGRVLQVGGGGVVQMENDLPWTAGQIEGAEVFNFNGESSTMRSDSDIEDSHVYFRIDGFGVSDDVAFQIGTLRELPGGLLFDGIGDRLVIVFEPDGGASSSDSLSFRVVERVGDGGFEISVDELTGRVTVDDL